MKMENNALNEKSDIHVKIGEVKIGKPGDILKATLGSCVGIAFVWKKRNLFGLAHCLLPESSGNDFVLGAKYVNQAIPSLMALLKIKKEDIGEIDVYFAGGGNMMSQLAKRNIDHVGTLNVEAARKYLSLNGFTYKELDTGGEVGRQIFINCSSGEVYVNRFEKIQTQ